MSKITASPDLAQVKPEDHQRFADLFANDTANTVNGNLDFQHNFNCKLIQVSFPSVNVQVAVPHGLGRVPQGYIVTATSTGMHVFNGIPANTSTTLYLQSSTTGIAGILVY